MSSKVRQRSPAPTGTATVQGGPRPGDHARVDHALGRARLVINGSDGYGTGCVLIDEARPVQHHQQSRLTATTDVAASHWPTNALYSTGGRR